MRALGGRGRPSGDGLVQKRMLRGIARATRARSRTRKAESRTPRPCSPRLRRAFVISIRGLYAPRLNAIRKNGETLPPSRLPSSLWEAGRLRPSATRNILFREDTRDRCYQRG